MGMLSYRALLAVLAAWSLAACTNTPSAGQHANASSEQLSNAGKSAGAAAKDAGRAVAEAAKSLDAGAGPAVRKAERDAAPAVQKAGSTAAGGLVAAGNALQGVAASGGAGNAARGKAIFAQQCAGCHGAHGQGGTGARLIGEHSRKDFSVTVSWIENPKPPMPKLYPSPLSEQDVKDAAAYVQTL